MDDALLRFQILDAAIRHAKRSATTVKDKRATVMFLLKAEEQEARRQRVYRYANACRVLHSQCAQAELLTSLLEELRVSSGAFDHTTGDPHSNTGPTHIVTDPSIRVLRVPPTPDTVKDIVRRKRCARLYEV